MFKQSKSLSSNLIFLGLIWPLRAFIQKGEGANVGVGSPWPLAIRYMF